MNDEGGIATGKTNKIASNLMKVTQINPIPIGNIRSFRLCNDIISSPEDPQGTSHR